MQACGVSVKYLSKRYGEDFCKHIELILSDVQAAQIDLFDIMAINEVAYSISLEIQGELRIYRQDYGRSVAGLSDFQTYHEAAMKRRHIGYLWKLYKVAKTDSAKLTTEYQKRLHLSQGVLPAYIPVRVAA